MEAPDTHVVMGRIGAPWGIKGWLKLFSFTDPPENLQDYSQYQIQSDNGFENLEFTEIRVQGSALVGHIKGCDVREDAARFTGKELWLEKKLLPTLTDGYYWHQLEGLRVQTLHGDDLGVVHHLLETGANDVLVVRGDLQSVDRKERLIPYVHESVVKAVDPLKGQLLVDWDKDWE